jgi:ParB family chromosome partitioning protein
MARAAPKIILSPSRDIPFDKLVLSQSNVRRVKNGVTIDDLADDIERRGLLHGLNVRPHLDESGTETDLFEVPAGGRRYSALAVLVKRKRLAKEAPVPCVVKAVDDLVTAEEDSLAENTFREPLHPLRGMQRLVDKGEKEEAIAAHFRVTPAVVRQRLKLASVSPKLHEVYAAGDMTLDHLMAFSVSDDHARQEQVWDQLPHSRDQSAQFIREKLNEDMVPVTDRRVRYIGVEAYYAAGGSAPARDLFEPDDGGWLSDPALLDRLVAEKLEADAATIKAEGWKWVEAMVELPYGYDEDCRYLEGVLEPPTEADEARIAELRAEADALETEWDGRSDMPAEVEARTHAIDVEIGQLSQGRRTYDPAEQARAGVFIGIEEDGTLYIDRGNVLSEDDVEDTVDEVAVGETGEKTGAAPDQAGDAPVAGDAAADAAPAAAAPGSGAAAATDDDEEDVIKPLPDRLVAELTASRTVALQDAFAQNPSVAFAAVLHAMVLSTIYQMRTESCLELSLGRVYFPFQAPGLRESAAVRAMEERHASWKARLPKSDKDAWGAIQQLDGADQAALFAHCAAYSVNALWEPVAKHGGGRVSAYGVARRIEHANVLARAVGFDMAAAGWRPTAENYLGRVSKPRILEAVAEGTEPQKAGLIDHLKKGDMAREAERLLADAGWLPEPLRLPVIDASLQLDEPEALPAFLDEGAEEEPGEYAVAAE